jgi:hypothetical protein
LLNNRLTTLSLISDRIYRKIIDVYFNKLSIEKNKPDSMFRMTKLFIQSLPSLRYISNFVKKGNLSKIKFKKDIFFLKLCLDIYGDYYLTFDYPCYKVYKTKFLKTAIEFYENMTDTVFEYIVSWYSHASMKNLSNHQLISRYQELRVY